MRQRSARRAGPRPWLLGAALALGCASSGDAEREAAGSQPPGETPREQAAPAEEEPLSESDAAVQELLRQMSVEYLPRAGRLELSGWVNQREGVIEVFACTPEGKTHESVLVLDCVPSGVHAGLVALGLEPGGPVGLESDGTLRPPSGDPVDVLVRWVDGAGAERTVRAEEWIWDARAGRPMTRCAWTFCGSVQQETGSDPPRRSYAANQVKSLVTTYHDATSVLENPHATGGDDTAYYANDKAVPPVGTPVTVVLAPAAPEEGGAR